MTKQKDKLSEDISILSHLGSYRKTSMKEKQGRPSLEVRWLKLQPPNAGGPIYLWVRELDPIQCNQEFTHCN